MTIPDELALELESRTERAKAEILSDIDRGVVPVDVTDFASLHDHVDANEYGGLCEEPFYSKLRGDGDDPSPLAADFANALQDAIDQWLKDGRP